MERWVPPGVDASRPNIARVYDCFLGGTDNFAVDREVAAQILVLMPDAPRVALDNRAFLRRAVRHLAGPAGIRQFLDIGSGLPTQWNVHQAAREVVPHARVVYVDNDRCKSGCAHAPIVDVVSSCPPRLPAETRSGPNDR